MEISMTRRRVVGIFAFVSMAALLSARAATASVIPVGIAAFGAGSTLTTFTGLANGLEVNGLVGGGIQFQYSLGNGQVIIGVGPGNTNNMAVPNIVSIGNDSGILTLMLPSLVDTFGYGYAILSTGAVANATTIALFNGATPVGTLSYNGVPDPLFTGGFAGIFSTLAFNRVQLTFNAAAAPAFAVDNIRTFNTPAAVPEPATFLLIGGGLAAIARARRRRG
jgi:PEP-CTERM motif